MIKFVVFAVLFTVGLAYKGGWDPRYCCYPPGEDCCPTVVTTPPGCPTCLDIALVVDNSSSIGLLNWDTYVVPFLKQFATTDQWEIGSGDDQYLVGMVSFSWSGKLIFDWSSSANDDDASLEAAFGELAGYRPQGITNIGGGMRKAREKIIEAAGNRDQCDDICVVIADGQVLEPIDPTNPGAGPTAIFDTQLPLFRDACSKIIAVGVTLSSALDMDLLETIASGDGDEYVVTVDDFDGLEDAFGEIADMLCPNGGGATTNGGGSSDCCPYDEPFYSKLVHGW